MKKITKSQLRKIIKEAVVEAEGPMTHDQATEKHIDVMGFLREVREIYSDTEIYNDGEALYRAVGELLEDYEIVDPVKPVAEKLRQLYVNMNVDHPDIIRKTLKDFYNSNMGRVRQDDPGVTYKEHKSNRMKITSSQLRKIIKEEYNKLIKEIK